MNEKISEPQAAKQIISDIVAIEACLADTKNILCKLNESINRLSVRTVPVATASTSDCKLSDSIEDKLYYIKNLSDTVLEYSDYLLKRFDSIV